MATTTIEKKPKLEDIKVHIIDDWYFASDGVKNFILYNKHTILDENSKNYNTNRYIPVGYYGKLEQLYEGLLRQITLENVNQLANTDLVKLISYVDEVKKQIIDATKHLAKKVEKYMRVGNNS